MAYVIAEPCIDVKDRACVDVCPVKAISAADEVPGEWKRYVEMNAAYYKLDRAAFAATWGTPA